MRYTVLFYVMLLLVSTFACQQETSSTEREIYYLADLYIRYLEEERNLKATAAFFEEIDSSGQLIPWHPEGKVLFQASSMEEKYIQNQVIRFIKESSELSFMPPFQFSFNSNQKKVDLQMDPIGLLSLEGTPGKQSGVRLTVEGGQLGESESMVFLFSDAQNKAYSHTVEGPKSENTYTLSMEDIADWPSGKGQLYLVKRQNKAFKSGNWTYQTQIEYYSKTLSFILNQ